MFPMKPELNLFLELHDCYALMADTNLTQELIMTKKRQRRLNK